MQDSCIVTAPPTYPTNEKTLPLREGNENVGALLAGASMGEGKWRDTKYLMQNKKNRKRISLPSMA